MDWTKIEKRALSIAGKGFRVGSHVGAGIKWWYICTSWGETATYVWKDGSINGSTGFEHQGLHPTREQLIEAYRVTPGFWRTKEEAEAFLEDWLDETADGCDSEAAVQESVQEAEGDGLQ